MRPVFLPLASRVFLAALAAAAVPGAMAARDNGGQASQDDSGGGRNCVKVMGHIVCKSNSASAAPAAVAPAMVAARLFAEGPSLSPGNDSRSFAVQGFARPGWPVAVDFLPQPGTVTLLTIAPYGTAASGSPARRALGKTTGGAAARLAPRPGGTRIVIDPTGRSGRRLFILPRLDIAPPQGSRERPLAIVTYRVESYRILAKGKLATKASPVEIFGFAAGPQAIAAPLAGLRGWPPARAVAALAFATAQAPPASMALTQLVLADGAATLPRPRQAAGAAIGYTYQLRRPFHLVAEDIWQECGGKACKLAFSRRLPNPTPLGRQGHSWTLFPKDSPGPYRLVVRAWLQCRNPDFARCADQAAFSFGRSAAVRVR